VTIHAFVRAPYDTYVQDDTRFWSASGLSIKLAGTGLNVEVESLRALLLGGIAFETPRAEIRAQAASIEENHVFPLFADRDTAEAASYTRKIPLVSYFPGSVGGLRPGSEVTLHGLVVGRVIDVRLVFDPAKDTVLAPVRYEVEPERVVGVGTQIYSTREAVDALIGRGLRASLQSASLITGAQQVALDFLPKAAPAKTEVEGADFVLPTTAGGGFAGIEQAANSLLAKVGTIPFDTIGKDLEGILKSVNELTSGTQLHDALTSLAATLAEAETFTRNLDRGTASTFSKLPQMANQLQKAVTNADRLMVSLDAGYGDNTKFNRSLDRLMAQLNDTATSIRALADLLARHPEALIKGRPKGGIE